MMRRVWHQLFGHSVTNPSPWPYTGNEHKAWVQWKMCKCGQDFYFVYKLMGDYVLVSGLVKVS